MDRPTCKTCPYWGNPSDVDHGETTYQVGECHRFPICPNTGEWAGTNDDEWCGEHPGFPKWIASQGVDVRRNISERDLSVRTRDTLKQLGVATWSELANLTAEELMAERNFGHHNLYEVVAKLGQRGLTLRNFLSSRW